MLAEVGGLNIVLSEDIVRWPPNSHFSTRVELELLFCLCGTLKCLTRRKAGASGSENVSVFPEPGASFHRGGTGSRDMDYYDFVDMAVKPLVITSVPQIFGTRFFAHYISNGVYHLPVFVMSWVLIRFVFKIKEFNWVREGILIWRKQFTGFLMMCLRALLFFFHLISFWHQPTFFSPISVGQFSLA